MEVDPKSRTTSPSTAMLSMSKSQNSPEPMILGNFVCLITLSRDSSSYMETKKEIIVNEASQVILDIQIHKAFISSTYRKNRSSYTNKLLTFRY